MAKDDMFKIIYCILQELYACKKQGVRVNKSDIGWERFCIPYSYWLDIMIEMQENGICEGRHVSHDKRHGACGQLR